MSVELLEVTNDFILSQISKNRSYTSGGESNTPLAILSAVRDTYATLQELVEKKKLTVGEVRAEIADSPKVTPSNHGIEKDTITCLSCGDKFKSLGKHLKYSHDLTAMQYRLEHNIPAEMALASSNSSRRYTKSGAVRNGTFRKAEWEDSPPRNNRQLADVR